MSQEKIAELVENITTLTRTYASTYRGNIDYQKYKHFQKITGQTIVDFDQERVRESLLCHVWHLPVLASYLHPFLEHKNDVDLGRVLMMLAIHDIGETIVWDVITTARNRTPEEDIAEQEAMKQLLSNEQYLLYQEYEHPTTYTWRFAKSIDKLWWQIMAYSNDPFVEKRRQQHFWFDTHTVEKKYKNLMKRDSFLIDFFDILISKTKEKLKNS